VERPRPRGRQRISAPLRIAAAGLALVIAGAGAAADRIELPPGPDRDLVYSRCRTCHDLQYVVDSAGIGADAWAAVIEDMGRYGLRVPAEERRKIVRYLVTHLASSPAKAAPAARAPAPAVDGKSEFERQCSACHQAEGQGVAGAFPPLAGNPDLFRDRLFPVKVVLNGLSGALTVKGQAYSGVMPPFDHLSDAEIAAVVNYVRGAWGNAALRPAGFAEIDAADVARARRP
jgi:mono/diheme cytochrome c family protein